jgi:hypothetical protein
MKNLKQLLILAALTAGLSGCMSSQKATVSPGADLGAIKNYYVVHLPQDGRKINQLICDDLNVRGYKATTGEAGNAPAGAEALVTYQDKWVWDMAMYMLQLDIQFRDPKTDIALASGEAMHTSLVRRSPPEMVKEVLNQIYQKASPPQAATPMGDK